jgi:methionyl-tRNA formyltransferase
MTEKPHRIVFMGTPEFAVASLQALYENSFHIAAVVTTPDRPSGRGQKITPSPVRKFAAEHGLPVMQPERLRDQAFIQSLKELHADIFVVVAFRMLPEEVWSIPSLGTFNLHASLLPQYRGAAPINHAIINGETMTGVTTFLIDREIDTGSILLKAGTEILPEDNAGTLHDRLMARGAELVVETAKGLINGTLKPVRQQVTPGMVLHNAPKIFPADTVIRWEKPAVKIHNLVRGLSPYPGAVTTLRSGDRTLRMKIFESNLYLGVNDIPGTILIKDKSRLIVSCGQGALEILAVQPEGRKRMTAAEFMRGMDLSGWETA